MRVRLGLHYDLRGPAGHAAERFAALLAHVEAADAAGVDVAWVAERPTEEDSLLPAALPVCAAIASRTRRLRVGTAVLPLPLHHPVRVAEDAATLDVLSGGRFELGVGLGADAPGARGFGVPAAERPGRLEEALALIRGAWSEGALHYAGSHFAVDGVEVWPKPAQRPGPPLWIGAGSPAAQRRAARLAVGLLLAPGAQPGPFLAAWRETAACLDQARLAIRAPALPLRASTRDVVAELRQRLAACTGIGSVDVVFPAPSGDASSALAREDLERLVSEVRPALDQRPSG